MTIHDSILDTIGNTPVVRLHRLPPKHVTVYAKAESFNPGGSVKDRLALAIVLDAEARGVLKPGDTIVEATSGNTGIALAQVAAARGYRFVAVMVETFSIERRKLMRAFGAKVILTPAAERGTGMVKKAKELAEKHGWFLASQFTNPANPAYHRQTTAAEILRDFAGKRVVRLKGGDPFVFGRGGEELEFLRTHDVPFEVIPGITAAVACAAYAGIPLTHRDHAQSVRLVTAHARDSLDILDWPALAQERQTLAFYMGVARLELLQQRLLAHGRGADTPFALIENGTRPEQRIVAGTLTELSHLARAHAVESPALLIVGEVAALAHALHWFGAAPLGAAAAPLAHAA